LPAFGLFLPVPGGYRFDIPKPGWPIQIGAPSYINFCFCLSYPIFFCVFIGFGFKKSASPAPAILDINAIAE
jgi:hypothetical protein